MKKSFLILLPLIILSACNPPREPTAKDILNNVIRLYNNHSSVSYYINYNLYLSRRDTRYSYAGKGMLIRDNKDSLFNGIIWLAIHKDGIDDRFYDSHYIYITNDSLKKYRVFKDNLKEIWRSGTIPENAEYPYFLRPGRLSEITNDAEIKDSLSIGKIGYKDYWKIECRFPDSKYMSHRWVEFWVGRNDTILKKVIFHLSDNTNDEQTEEQDIDSVAFDKVTPAGLDALMKKKLSSFTLSNDTPEVIAPLKM